MKFNTAYAIGIPRIGLSFIFIWFGIEQLTNTVSWIGYMPDYVINLSHLNGATLVHLNGAFELVFGISLMCGLYTRISALLLGIHLAHITAMMGFNEIGIRDFGIVMGVLGVFFYGPDSLSLDMIHFSKEELEIKSIPPKTMTPANPPSRLNKNIPIFTNIK